MMAFNWLRKLAGWVVIFLLFTGTVPASADPGSPHGLEKEVDGIRVELVFKAEPVKSGSNGVIVRLEGSSHQPIENAKVILTVVSHNEDENETSKNDSHGMQPEPKKDDHADDEDGHDSPKPSTLKAGHAPGEYEGKINFPAAGKWEVHITFVTGGDEKEIDFPVEVIAGGKPWLLVGGFFGINTAIIVTAGITRSDRSKKSKEIS